MKRYLILCLLGLAPLAYAAQGSAAAVDFTAQTMTYHPKTGQVQLEGNVNITRADLNLTCTKIVMDVDKQGNISTMTATGNVIFTRQSPAGEEIARGSTAVYQPAAGKLRLTGGVTLTQGGNTLNGEVLDYDLTVGKVNLSGGRSTIKGRFMPAATSGTVAP